MVKTLQTDKIVKKTAAAITDALYAVEPAALKLIQAAAKTEANPRAAFVLRQILENAEEARASRCPACQDCGLAVFFVEIGRELRIDGDLDAALNGAVRRAYLEGYLRKSVADPLTRVNTGDNTPATIHYSFTEGDRLKISFLAKGAGSENMGAVRMLSPADGLNGVKGFVLETVRKAGANPCPPIIAGIGIGGSMEGCALLAKRALIRETGAPSPDPALQALEAELLTEINALGIGAAGLGGGSGCLAVHAEKQPTHIGMLPVAVNIQCHSVRHFTMIF